MFPKNANHRKLVRLLIFTGFLFLAEIAYPQSANFLSPLNHLKTDISSSLNESISQVPSLPVPPWIVRSKNLIFLDSLKSKASKNYLTKKIYDIVVINTDFVSKKDNHGTSEEAYIGYSGRKIRKIEIKKLNVFGADINNPDAYNPGRSQNILNKTHFNTNEKIIRKNLLFSVGDTLSPIALSDNERILRGLPFIDDARINIVPVSNEEVDIIVITKDVYSLGGTYDPASGLKKGTISVFEKNVLGIGHGLGISVPFDSDKPDSPGFGFHYIIDNIARSFINMKLFYNEGLGQKFYGVDIRRNLVSSATKYAGGISVRHMDEKIGIVTPEIPEPFRYNIQDYWLARSFLLNKESVKRIIIGSRYTNNNVFDRPFILPDSYHSMQKYRIFLSSIAFSVQKYYKANLIYGYGRTEDIPYGGLLKVTVGREINEFKKRNYAGSEVSYSSLIRNFGYLYSSAGLAAYINNHHTEQGILSVRLKYFSNLMPVGRNMIRTFIRADYTRGFDRNLEEHLNYFNDNGFSGFRNDSVNGSQRLTLNLESVIFSHANFYGFRFAFFGFADFSALSGANQILGNGTILSGLGLGIRIRNDNLVFNTFQIRLGFFPDAPSYSRINYITVSGEQLLRPDNFESGPPSMIPFR